MHHLYTRIKLLSIQYYYLVLLSKKLVPKKFKKPQCLQVLKLKGKILIFFENELQILSTLHTRRQFFLSLSDLLLLESFIFSCTMTYCFPIIRALYFTFIFSLCYKYVCFFCIQKLLAELSYKASWYINSYLTIFMSLKRHSAMCHQGKCSFLFTLQIEVNFLQYNQLSPVTHLQ